MLETIVFLTIQFDKGGKLLSRRNKRTNFEESAMLNNKTWLYYYNRLKELAISMFDWQNMPDSIDIRYLETALFEQGHAIFFRDDVLGYLTLKCTYSGGLDVYGIPTKRRAYGNNGYNIELNNDNSVIIFNNYLHTNTSNTISMFATRLYEIQRTIDVNVKAQKTPTLIQGTAEQKLTLVNLYKEYDGNSPVIYSDKNLDLNVLKVLKTDAPFVSDRLNQLKMDVWNEALTFLGISNINIQKRERLISDEVTRNMGGVVASRYSRLEERKKSADIINKMFNLDISVEYHEDNIDNALEPTGGADYE